ncbi:helix-turn-helix domain-containing protein [Sulfurovum sp. CS9]|uniref:helix-turn-helix domain-containing protein n=1 Tax=Sulfurovum sp. CS9 TaxID=3391146 RepID=UPI0039E9A2BC
MIELMSPYDIMSKFVKIIEKERIRQGLRQSDLYNKAGISSSAYANFLKKKNTSFENIVKLLYALNMTSNIEGLLTFEKYTSIEEIRTHQKRESKKRVKKASS